MGAATLTLYQHIDDYETALQWLDEHEDEIVAAGGELPPALAALLDQVEGALEEKVQRIALLIQNMKANASVAKQEAGRLAALANSYDRKAESLKSYLGAQLGRAGLQRVETARAKVRIQKNGRPSIRLADPSRIPEAYRKVTVTFDGAAAYEALKRARCLPDEPGAIEIEGLVVELGTHVRIW